MRPENTGEAVEVLRRVEKDGLDRGTHEEAEESVIGWRRMEEVEEGWMEEG